MDELLFVKNKDNRAQESGSNYLGSCGAKVSRAHAQPSGNVTGASCIKVCKAAAADFVRIMIV